MENTEKKHKFRIMFTVYEKSITLSPAQIEEQPEDYEIPRLHQIYIR